MAGKLADIRRCNTRTREYNILRHRLGFRGSNHKALILQAIKFRTTGLLIVEGFLLHSLIKYVYFSRLQFRGFVSAVKYIIGTQRSNACLAKIRNQLAPVVSDMIGRVKEYIA